MQSRRFSYLKRVPLLRLFVPFLAGIIASFYCGIPLFALQIFTLVCLIFLFVAALLPAIVLRRMNSWINVIILGLFFALGGLACCLHNQKNSPDNIVNLYASNAPVMVTLAQALEEKPASFSTFGNVEAIYINQQWRPATGKIILNFKKDSLSKKLHYGNQLIITNKLDSIKNWGNPNEFDYAAFCAFKNIFLTSFLTENGYQLLPKIKRNSFQETIFSCREKVLAQLQKFIPNPKNSAVAEALLIGYKNNIDKSTIQAYATTGVLHIIAISGMHLGMIYGCLIFYFSFIQNKRLKRWFVPLFILSILWFFTFLTGAEASIVRSAIIFSFLLFGQLFNKKTNVYNSLIASAFFILIFQPFALWQIGFQLSYAAVLSILIFYKPIYNEFVAQNKIIKYFWQIIAITLAAQIFTLPFSLFYFHQFPLLVVITNLFIIPLSGIILIGEIILVGLGFCLPFIAHYFGIIINALLWLMDTIIAHFNALPFVSWTGISLSLTQAFLLGIAFVFLGFYVYQKNKTYLFFLGFSLVCLFALRFLDIYKTHHQEKLILYNIPKKTMIEWITGNKTTVFTTGELSAREENILQTAHSLFRIKHSIYDSLEDKYFFQNKEIALLRLDSNFKKNKYAFPEATDFVVLTHNAPYKIQELKNNIAFDLLIIDASNNKWQISRWKKEADSLLLPHYIIAEKGAFVYNLKTNPQFPP